jgi:hypothetical protein
MVNVILSDAKNLGSILGPAVPMEINHKCLVPLNLTGHLDEF